MFRITRDQKHVGAILNILTSLCTPIPILEDRFYAVTQLLEALRYKPEGRGFDSRRCHCNFSLT